MSLLWQGKYLEAEILYSKAGIATQILLTDRANKNCLLMDCGDGTVRDLLDRSINLRLLKGILISHGHIDHIGGLLSLLFTLYLVRYEGEFIIIAPCPCRQVYSIIQFFLNLYRGRLSFTLNYHELYSGVFESLGDFIIKPFEVIHFESIVTDKKKMPAFGYRVVLKDEVVVYSGDTIESSELEKEVEEVDLAIIEATYDSSFHGEYLNHLYFDYAEYVGKSAKNYFLIHRYENL